MLETNIPDFKSNIPPHLLEGTSPQQRWIMEQNSIHGQRLDWLATEQIKQSKELSEIKAQTTRTNGRVTSLERLNEDREVERKDYQEMLGDVKYIVALKRVLSKKWVWGLLLFAGIGLVALFFPWVIGGGLKDIIGKVFFGL